MPRDYISNSPRLIDPQRAFGAAHCGEACLTGQSLNEFRGCASNLLLSSVINWDWLVVLQISFLPRRTPLRASAVKFFGQSMKFFIEPAKFFD